MTQLIFVKLFHDPKNPSSPPCCILYDRSLNFHFFLSLITTYCQQKKVRGKKAHSVFNDYMIYKSTGHCEKQQMHKKALKKLQKRKLRN